jgi:hypothetical protein
LKKHIWVDSERLDWLQTVSTLIYFIPFSNRHVSLNFALRISREK